MNILRFLGAILAVFIFIFFFDWIVHGIFLKGYYGLTPQAWRPMDEMMTMMPYAMAFQLAFAAWFTFVYTRLFKEGSIKNGLLYGLYFGVFMGIMAASWYSWLPISKQLAVSWFVSSVLEGLGAGLILGFIFCECSKMKNSRAVDNKDNRNQR